MKKLLFISLFLLVSYFTNGQETSLTKAWEAYNKHNWSQAKTNAEDCIFSFELKATEIQNKLIRNGYTLPRNYTLGNALSAQQKAEIFSHGLLNDVCVSYWLVGMSCLRLKDKENARIAFHKVIEFSFGLCYDKDRSFFWSPSDDAALRLKSL